MDALRTPNLGLRFGLELALLAALAWYGAGHGWVAVAFACLVALSEALTWTGPR